MQYQNGLEFSLYFEGVDSEIMPSEYSFSIEDSIYDFYPTAQLNLNDSTGILQEYLFTVEGAKYDISIGYDGDYIEAPFIVKSDELQSTLTEGLLNGSVKLDLIHEYKGEQELKSAYYNAKISTIVSNILENYTFTDTDIDTTGNDQEWYQLLVGQVDFINKYLLPFAYSSSANNSPFFYFVDSQNRYNFKSYYSMINRANPIELTLTPGTIQGSTNKSIRSIQRLRKGMDITFDLRSRRIFNFNEDSGAFNEQDDNIKSYPNNVEDIPIIGDSSHITGAYLLEDSNSDTYTKEALKGLLSSSMKDTCTLDRFVLELAFNPEVVAGTPISLVIPSSDDPDSASLNLSGIYLCEKTIHVWDGQRATTYLIVGRKDTFIPSGMYLIKDKLFS